MSDAPLGIKIISALQGIISFLILIGGAFILLAATETHFNPANCTPGLLCSSSVDPLLGAILAILGLTGIGLAYGLWIGNSGVYLLNLVFLVIELIGLGYSLASSFQATMLISAIVDGAIFVYLILPDTRDYFS